MRLNEGIHRRIASRRGKPEVSSAGEFSHDRYGKRMLCAALAATLSSLGELKSERLTVRESPGHLISKDGYRVGRVVDKIVVSPSTSTWTGGEEKDSSVRRRHSFLLKETNGRSII